MQEKLRENFVSENTGQEISDKKIPQHFSLKINVLNPVELKKIKIVGAD